VRIPIWQVDAFTDAVFGGNPAAVCPLDAWLPEPLMLAIAAENALSETAFLVRGPARGAFEIRWFTPEVEVDLCGHATLASAHVVFEHLDPTLREVTFASQSGPLTVARGEGGLLVMTLPRRAPEPCEPPAALVRALGRRPTETWRARDYLAVLGSEDEVRAARPHLHDVAALDAAGLIVTAASDGAGADFVSRYFAPQAGIPEDPVTGSAHATLVPYWAARLGRARLEAHQVSRRGGRLSCEDRPADALVVVAGRAAEYLSGTIALPPG
jgi:predicted PhzF superfamily epimerase YddE/YHI9